jgi:hypothetical protein
LSLATGAALLLAGAAVAADAPAADVCLELAPEVVGPEEWSSVVAAVAEAVTPRTALFPAPSLDETGTRLAIDAGDGEATPATSSCLESGFEWSARFDRAFLQAGAERMLAEAPTTPGITSAVDIEWLPAESRLRTVLVFAGPLDIPNGTCWIDDVIAIEDGVVTASGERGLRTSPFAEGACGRFYEHLPQGGAGEQAVTLLPATVMLSDGRRLRFEAQDVSVREDALVVSGSLARE